MKKLISILLCAVMLMTLAACGERKQPEEPPSAPVETEISAEKQTLSPTERPAALKLSEMSEEDCIASLREFGADIPEGRETGIMSMVAGFEENIDRPYPGDVYFDEAYALYESVRAAVRAYYISIGEPLEPAAPTEAPTPEATVTPEPVPTLKPIEEFPLPDDPEAIGDCIKDAEVLAYLPFDDEELDLGFAGEFEIDVYMRKPEAFCLKDGKVYVLDSVKNRVIVCENGGYSFITFSDADVWNYYMTMAIVDDRIYVCNTEEEMDRISVYDMSGTKLDSIRIPMKAYENGVSALFDMDGHLAMYDHGLVLYELVYGEFVEQYDIEVKGILTPELNITAGDKRYWLNAGENTNPGVIRIVDDRVYCWVRELDIGGYSYRVYTAEGELLGSTSLDVENVLGYPDSPMFISSEGEVYIMCCMQDGVYITKPHLRTEYVSHLDVIIDAGY